MSRSQKVQVVNVIKYFKSKTEAQHHDIQNKHWMSLYLLLLCWVLNFYFINVILSTVIKVEYLNFLLSIKYIIKVILFLLY